MCLNTGLNKRCVQVVSLLQKQVGSYKHIWTHARAHACIHTHTQIHVYTYMYIRKSKLITWLKYQSSGIWVPMLHKKMCSSGHKLCLNHLVKVTALDMILHLLQSTNNFTTHARSTRASWQFTYRPQVKEYDATVHMDAYRQNLP